MSHDVDEDELPVVEGSLAGIAAWILGYAFTYILAGRDVRESPLNRFIETVEGEAATYELVGWVFYNAHLVDVVYDGLGGAVLPGSFIGGDEGFSLLLYAVPVAVLLAAGLAVGRYRGVTGYNRGAVTGLTVLPGYLALCVVGVFLFRVSAVGTTGQPDMLPAILLAGVIYPAVFAGAGGAIAGVTVGEGGARSSDR